MATSILYKRFCGHLKTKFYQHRSGYIILLPEINPNISDHNRLFKGGLPNIENLTKEKCVETMGKQLLDLEHCVREVEDDVINNEQEDVRRDIFDLVIEPLEAFGSQLEMTWGLVKTLYIAEQDRMPQHVYLPIHERARRARSSKYNSHHIYYKFKDCDMSKLNEEEKRVVSKFLIEGKLNGLELDGDHKLLCTDIMRKLNREKQDFVQRAREGLKKFSHVIEDPNVMKDFPEDIADKMSIGGANGPWKVTLNPEIFPRFMQYCPDNELRYNAWVASRHFCSITAESELQNSSCLQKIRSLRRDLAKVLEYDSFAHMSMETKMARGLDEIQEMLAMYLQSAKPAQEKEINDLQKFAEERGLDGTIQIWDIPYWSRKQKRTLFGWEEGKQKVYFPFDKVFEGLRNLCSSLFGVTLVEAPEVKTWHPDVKFYHIFERDGRKPIAGFYFDPFARESKLHTGGIGQMIGIRPSARVFGPMTPIAALIFNFDPPTDNQPSLLWFSSVENVFRKFGSLMQHLLCTVSYSEVSGLSNIEWDAVDVVSNLMTLFLNDPVIFKSISGHYETNEPLPFDSMEEIRKHMAGFDLCHELYLASVDLKLCLSKDYWGTVARDEWMKHMAIPTDRNDSHLCSQTDIIAGELAANYYSRIWSRMLAADAYTSFQNNKGNQPAVGERFRNTFLRCGGSVHPIEVFRRFQGRDPEKGTLLKSLGLPWTPESEEQ